jgi:signal transduction histidine kinase
MRDRRGFALDFRITRPDGSIRYVHSKGHPVLDDAGVVVEVMGVIMDVTDRKRAERALRRARERTLEARFAAMLAERTRLAREIHDTLLQGFTGVGLKLVAVANRVTAQPQTAAELREVVALAQKTLEDARRAVWDMRSPSLAAGEFAAALRSAVGESTQGTGLSLVCEVEGDPRPVDPEVEAVVFRVVQEAIANAVKHATAHAVRVRCVFGARQMRVTITDDGRGFTVDPDFRAYGGHWGLLGMRERAGQIGAKVAVRSSPGQGVRVTLLVPYRARGGPDPRQA